MKDIVIKVILGAFIGWMLGFFVSALIVSITYKREQPTEYQHYVPEQKGMNYCPDCGEKLKKGTQNKVIL